jgi:hypothetical protein
VSLPAPDASAVITVRDWLELAAVILAAATFLVGVFQYGRAQRWKRAEFVAGKIREFEAYPEVDLAMRMLDWNRRRVELFPEDPDPAKRAVWVSGAVLASALGLGLDEIPGAADERDHEAAEDQDLEWGDAALQIYTPQHPHQPPAVRELYESPEEVRRREKEGPQGVPGRYGREEARLRDIFDRFLTEFSRFEVFIEAGLVTADEFDPYISYWVSLIADPSRGGKSPKFTKALWQFIEDYGYTGVQSLCRRYGYDIQPQIELLPGDITFTRGRGFISRMIRLFTRRMGESRTKVNHVGVVVTQGPLREAVVVEALSRVRRHPLHKHYADGKTEVAVFRPYRLNEDEQARVVKAANAYTDCKYGYLMIAAHWLDWLLLGAYCFRRVVGSSNYPICSWLVAESFAQAGVRFGCEPRAASPDDIWDYVTDLQRRSRFEQVRALSLL